MYIPTLTKELLDDPLAKDPTGILVGNPVMCDDAYNLVQTQISPSIIEPDIFIVISDIDESYKFGFMAPDTYHTLTSDECSDAFEMMNDDDDDDGDDDDDNQMNYFYNNDDGRMDDDQQQQDPERSKKTRAGTRLPSKTRKLFQMLHKKRNKDGVGTRLPLGNRNKLQRMLRKRRQTKQKETRAIGFNPVVKKCLSAFYEGSFGSAAYMYADGIDPYGVYNPWLGDGLVPASPLDEYLSQDTVQTALHVEVADVTTFHSCGGGRVSYTKQYACNGPDSEFPDISMINFYQEIAPKLKKTWIISGDTDTVIPMEVSLWHASFDYRLFCRAFSLTFSVFHLCLLLFLTMLFIRVLVMQFKPLAFQLSKINPIEAGITMEPPQVLIFWQKRGRHLVLTWLHRN